MLNFRYKINKSKESKNEYIQLILLQLKTDLNQHLINPHALQYNIKSRLYYV